MRRRQLEYFPLDVDVFQDVKIRKLIKYQSGKAVTVYTLLLCLIYKNGYYMKWDTELPFIVSELTGFGEAYILEALECCVRLGLFDEETYRNHAVLTSRGIQHRYQMVCKLQRRQCDICEYAVPGMAVAPAPIVTLQADDEDYFNEMKNAPMWSEQMCIMHHMTLDDLYRNIDEFALDCKCRAHTHTSSQDAKRHFNNWLNVRATLRAQQPKKSKEQIKADALAMAQRAALERAMAYGTSNH